MNVVTLHVLYDAHSADFGLMRYAAPALEPDARVLVFEGLPPDSVSGSPNLALTVLQGDLDGHRVYAEQIPDGVTLEQLAPPQSLAAWVAAGVLGAVLRLRKSGAVHGRVMPDRVQLGINGEVVLFGRGRMGGTPEHDLEQMQHLLGELGMTLEPDVDLEALHTRLWAAADPSDRQALATLVGQRLPERSVQSHVHVQVGPTPDSLDEIQPDLGPDEATSPGLLDRWAVTTHHGTDEHTAELTGSVAESTSPLALTLWTALAAPPVHPPPQDRFRSVEGESSRGLRALLVGEPPDSLPGLPSGRVQSFLQSIDESTQDDDRDEDTFPEVTPVDDDDGDTAIYDLREKELLEAIRKADERTKLADLEARITDAERRAQQAEQRAKRAEADAAAAREKPPEGISLAAFFRVEVFVAVALFALMAWLAWQAFG